MAGIFGAYLYCRLSITAAVDREDFSAKLESKVNNQNSSIASIPHKV